MLYRKVNRHTGERETLTQEECEREMRLLGAAPEQVAEVLERGWWAELRHWWFKPVFLPPQRPMGPG